jgi:putative ABC transport system substrate-binding protein
VTSRRCVLLLCVSVWLTAAGAVASAQTAKTPARVVFILAGTEEQSRPFKESLLEGMRQAGQIEGQTFVLVTRNAGPPDRVPALIQQSVAERPDVLVVAGLTAARTARDATSTVPIVVATSSDLADSGIVKTLAQPGGNITGVSDLADELAVKRLELLKAALPKASRVALINNPDFPATPKIETRVAAAAPSLGITILRIHARDRASLMQSIDSLAASRPDALLLGGDPLFNVYATELIERAAALRIPVVHYWPGTAEAGALLSHQADIRDNYRRAAGYVDKILRGAKPGDLPIHQPTHYKLIVNAKVARALGLTLPQSLLLRADEVIQ